jgi:hypothetical protein
MNIEDILEMMGDVLDKALAVPFSGKKSMIDVEKMSNLINELHNNMPEEIRQARSVVAGKRKIEDDARHEADLIIKRAEERARQMISSQEITRLAQAKAEEIMLNAQQRSKELRNTTTDYVDNMLRKNEDMLARNLTEVKKARQSLRNSGR